MLIVKAGGAAGVDLDTVCADLADLAEAGKPWILVHGGSHETNVVAEKLGHPPKFVTSVSGYTSRYTDRTTLEIFEMVYCGKTNKGIVERLQKRGIQALGLSGIDGRLLEGKRKGALRVREGGKTKIIRDDLSGKIDRVNTDLLNLLTGAGYYPVICPPGIAEDGTAINTDGDRAAARIAAALGAETLVILSDVPGLLAKFPDESSLIPHIALADVDDAAERYAEGRMKIKLLGAAEAVRDGVGKVILADSRVENPIRAALDGGGTTIEA